jgi:hypothetical protein
MKVLSILSGIIFAVFMLSIAADTQPHFASNLGIILIGTAAYGVGAGIVVYVVCCALKIIARLAGD